MKWENQISDSRFKIIKKLGGVETESVKLRERLEMLNDAYTYLIPNYSLLNLQSLPDVVDPLCQSVKLWDYLYLILRSLFHS